MAMIWIHVASVGEEKAISDGNCPNMTVSTYTKSRNRTLACSRCGYQNGYQKVVKTSAEIVPEFS